MFVLPYQAIANRLGTELSGIAPLIQCYLGEPAQDGEGNLLYTTPAVFIKFSPVRTQSRLIAFGLPSIQYGEMEVTVILIDDCVYDDDRRILDTGLNHLAKAEAIYLALQNFSPLLSDLPGNSALLGTQEDAVIFNEMERVGITPDHGISNLLRTEQTFRCVANDLSALPGYIEILRNLDLALSLEVTIDDLPFG